MFLINAPESGVITIAIDLARVILMDSTDSRPMGRRQGLPPCRAGDSPRQSGREYCDKGNQYQSLAIYYINFYMVWTALTNCSPNIKRWSCMKTRTYVCSLKVKMLYINYCRISHNIIWSAKCWFMLTAYTYNLAAIVYSHYHIYTYSHFLCYFYMASF